MGVCYIYTICIAQLHPVLPSPTLSFFFLYPHMSFIRQSKFRHVYGQPAKKELCYDNIRVTKNAWDSNIVKANPKYISVNWDTSGGGSFAVIPINEAGKLPDVIPLCRGHTAAVLDTDFNPFNDQIIASASDDGKIGIWEIPEDFTLHYEDIEFIKDLKPLKKLSGHTRKVGHVKFSPVVENVLASSSNDYTIRIWDIQSDKPKLTLQHKDLITSFAFNYNGNQIASVSRDKKIRVWDIRSGKIISEGPGHAGAKSSRIVWLGNTNRLVTTGFSRLSDRQIAVWDSNNIEAGCIGGFYNLDVSSGITMPFYDESTKMLFLAGKGDGNIRYYEFENDELFELSEYSSTEPQRGIGMLPKRGVNVHENEVTRFFKTVDDHFLEPISFIVPRRSEMFQFDIYPDAPAKEAAISANDWFAGKSVDGPKMISMEALYEGEQPEIKDFVKEDSEEPELESKPEPKIESKPINSVKATPKQPSFVQPKSDELFKSDKTDSLLDKATSNDLTEGIKDVVGDSKNSWGEGDDKPVIDNTPENLPSASDSLPDYIKNKSRGEPKVTNSQVSPAPFVSTPKVSTPAAVVSTPKVSTKAELSPAPVVSGAVKAKGTTLKGTVDRLDGIVSKLEGVITTLVEANLEKDERISSLESKIETLLKKE